MSTQSVARPPLSVLILYGLGQLGWSLTTYSVANTLNYFYMPPEVDKQAVFPTFIPAEVLFLGMTYLGLIAFGGRLFDALIDPLVAQFSDKMPLGKWGKRRKLMALGALPLAVFSLLVFIPISDKSVIVNLFWLAITLLFHYMFFAIYVIPYMALIGELGHHPTDRLRISTIISVTWALGFILGTTLPFLQTGFEKLNYNSVLAFQLSVAVCSLVGLVFMLMPVFFLDENKYAKQGDSDGNFWESMLVVIRWKNFQLFAFSNFFYWLALNFIQTGMIYYITVLFGMEKQMATLFGLISFVCSFLFYPFISMMVKRIGKKKTLRLGYAVFLVVFVVMLSPINAQVAFYTIAVLASLPLAIFGILPNSMIADEIEAYELVDGQNRSGMFFAVNAFTMKLGISVANLLLPSLLIFGKSSENDWGVRLTVVAAALFCILGFVTLAKYKER